MPGGLAQAYYIVNMHLRGLGSLLLLTLLFGCKSEAPGTAAEPNAITLKELTERFKSDRTKIVGTTVRLEGRVKSISLNAMTLGADKGLAGPSPQGVPGGLYAVPFEVAGFPSPGVCWVDADLQRELLKDFEGAESLTVTMVGVVEPTFGQLAPCKISDKKLLKK